MTRIILVIDTQPQATYITDDPRPVRELIKLINTGHLVIGLGDINLGGPAQQYAMAMPSQNTITVMRAPAPVRISPRHYDVLYGLADGKTCDQIAMKYHLHRRTVFKYVSELKQRFDVQTRDELLICAAGMGLF